MAFTVLLSSSSIFFGHALAHNEQPLHKSSLIVM